MQLGFKRVHFKLRRNITVRRRENVFQRRIPVSLIGRVRRRFSTLEDLSRKRTDRAGMERNGRTRQPI